MAGVVYVVCACFGACMCTCLRACVCACVFVPLSVCACNNTCLILKWTPLNGIANNSFYLTISFNCIITRRDNVLHGNCTVLH